jgi:hypothetical protein
MYSWTRPYGTNSEEEFTMNAIAKIEADSLTELDWRIVEIAKLDGPRSINPDGKLSRFLRSFFGLPIARGLANDKLEALRRFCVRAWFWDLIRTSDVRSLIDAGYSSTAVFQILAHVAGSRGFTPSLQEQPI